MRFCELAKILHKYRLNKRETTAMCVKILTDAILDDVALESLGGSGKEYNPMYEKADSTLQAIYSGTRLQISQEDAALMHGRIDEEKFVEFVNSFSYDAIAQISKGVQEYGFDATPDTVGEILGNIMGRS